MIDRHHLQVILAFSENQSLTAAAKQLHLSQSALSHSIKKLEQQIGTELFIKEGRRLRLSHAGHYLLGVAKRLIPQLQQADQTLLGFAAGSRGNLRIGMECHPCYRWLMKVLSPYIKTWPDVAIDVKQKFQFGGLRALVEHDIDMLVTPDPQPQPELFFTPVFEYEVVLAVAKSHELAQMAQATAQDIAPLPLLTYPVSKERLDIFTDILRPAELQPLTHTTLEDTEIMLQMVAAGRGVAVFPKWLVEEYQDRLPLVGLRLNGECLKQQGLKKAIYLGVRESDRHLRYIDQFLQQAKTFSASNMAAADTNTAASNIAASNIATARNL